MHTVTRDWEPVIPVMGNIDWVPVMGNIDWVPVMGNIDWVNG